MRPWGSPEWSEFQAELARSAADETCQAVVVGVLWGRCWEGGGAPPLWPWVQIITTLAEGCDDETLAAYLGAGAASIAQVVPGLTERVVALFIQRPYMRQVYVP